MIGDLILAVFISAAIFTLADRRIRAFLEAAAIAIFVRKRHFYAIPIWLLPFALAICFEKQTRFFPDLIAGFFYFEGRWLFPVNFLYTVHRTYLSPIIEPGIAAGTHIVELAVWGLLSVLFGLATKRIQFKYAILLAPLVILATATVFHVSAAALGLRFWGLPFRVVG